MTGHHQSQEPASARPRAGPLGALGRIGGPGGGALAFQAGCLGLSLLLLAVAGPCWRRAHAEGDLADGELRMFEEL